MIMLVLKVTKLIVAVMTLPTTVMTVFVLFLVTMVVMTLSRCSPSSPPITVTPPPLSPRQYNTRDRQLVLNRLPMLPLSGALYVTFNSVQIDFVYFIARNAFTSCRAQKQGQWREKVVSTKLQQQRARSEEAPVVGGSSHTAAAVASELLLSKLTSLSGVLSVTQQINLLNLLEK